MSIKVRSQTSIAAVSVSGKSGRLRSILVQDTESSSAFDATISINIDGTGAVVYDLNTWSTTGGAGANLSFRSSVSQKLNVEGIGIAGGGTTDTHAGQLDFNLEFSTSLAITVTNADNYHIFWDEDVF